MGRIWFPSSRGKHGPGANPLSINLRQCVIAAVAKGMSRRVAAKRLVVAPSPAIK